MDLIASKLNSASQNAFLGTGLFCLLYLPVKCDGKSVMNRRSLISMDTCLCMVSKSELAVNFLIFCIWLIYLEREGKEGGYLRLKMRERKSGSGSQLLLLGGLQKPVPYLHPPSLLSALTLCSVLRGRSQRNTAAAAACRPKGDLLSSWGMMHYLVYSWLKWKWNIFLRRKICLSFHLNASYCITQ